MRVKFMLRKKQMIEIIGWSKKTPSTKIQNQICALAEKHRVSLLKQWEQVHQS